MGRVNGLLKGRRATRSAGARVKGSRPVQIAPTARLTAPCRLQALVAGHYQTHDGSFIRLRKMLDAHLVNALLRALADKEPKTFTKILTAEVVRRGLTDYALRVCAERDLGDVK